MSLRRIQWIEKMIGHGVYMEVGSICVPEIGQRSSLNFLDLGELIAIVNR